MNYFLSPDIPLGAKLLEIIYIVIGLITLYTGIKNGLDKENPSRFSTALFWCTLGIILGFGRWIPDFINGIFIIIMTIPAILKKVSSGTIHAPTQEYTEKMAAKIGLKVFIPALAIGLCAIIFAVLTDLGALVGVGAGILLSILILMLLSPDNKPLVFLNDSERLLSTVGPLSILPMLLASLGAIFTAAGVGDIIAKLAGSIIPEGNIIIGIIVFALGMMLFTMIMGNAFAAITVMTVGIGAPFVLSYGANPVVVGMLALTCGYCGTLCTPMAANFNIVPIAMLGMKNRMGVIKNQIPIALVMVIIQIIFMILFH